MSVTFDFDVKSNFSPVSCYNYENLNSMVMFVCTVMLQTVVRASLQLKILLENFSHYYPTCPDLSSHVFLPEGCSGCCCGSPLCDSIPSVVNLLFFRCTSTPSSGTAAGDSFPCSALLPLCFSDPPAQSREQNKD